MQASAIRLLESVLGLPCWQVRWDNQVGLDMNFGAPWMQVEEPRSSTARSPRVRALFARRRVFLKGTHWLVAYPESWRIALADGLTARRTSSSKRQDIAVARLKGEKVEGIVISSRSGATTLHFDLGATLEIRPARGTGAEPRELWALHAPRSRVVALFSHGMYRVGSTRASDETLMPIARRPSDVREVVIGKVPKADSGARPSRGRRRVAAV